jgi:hypothetical protein
MGNGNVSSNADGKGWREDVRLELNNSIILLRRNFYKQRAIQKRERNAKDAKNAPKSQLKGNGAYERVDESLKDFIMLSSLYFAPFATPSLHTFRSGVQRRLSDLQGHLPANYSGASSELQI